MKETNNYVYLAGLKCVRSVKSEKALGETYKIRECLHCD